MKKLFAAVALTIAALAQSAIAQTGYLVTVNTSSLNGQPGTIDLQYNAGALTTQNSCIAIGYFLTDGTLGSPAATTGSVTGTLTASGTNLAINNGPSGCTTPTTYTASTFNDYNQPITFGNTLSFFVTLNGPGVAAPAGNNNGNSGSSFGVDFTVSGTPALTGDPSNFAGTIVLNPDGTITTTGLPAPGNNPSLVTIQAAELVTVATSPSGLSFTVDSDPYTASQTFAWAIGSGHTLATTSPQGTGGTHYYFSQWSDTTATTTDSITVSTGTTTYTAQFNTEYLLTTAANPSTDGLVTVNTASPTSDGYYPSTPPVSITATPNTGYNFSSWTGNVANTSNATTTVTMSGPESVTANFAVNNANVTIGTSPSGLSFVVDTVTYNSPQTFTWQVGSTHNVAVASPQGSNGTRYTFLGWSGGNTPSVAAESISVTGTATYTANFSTAYLLTAYADPSVGGSVNVTTVSPTGDGYYPAGTAISIGETPSGTWVFSKWSGTIGSTTTPLAFNITKPWLAIANFVEGTVQVNVGTNPNGLTYTVDSTQYTSNTTLTWTIGTKHTISVGSPQDVPGAVYTFESFCDGGAISHTIIAPPKPENYIATFTPTYQLTFKPTYMSFPAQGVNTTSAAEALTVTNGGTGSVTLGTLSISDNEYAIPAGGNGCSTAIAGSGGSCTIKFTFTPNQTGLRTGTLSVPVVGGLVAQQVSLRGTGAGALLSPLSLYFAAQHGNTTGANETLTLTNFLSTSLPYGSASFAGANPGDFPIQGGTCSTSGGTLAASGSAGSTCTYSIAFHPTANGAETATLSISAAGTQTANLAGTGIGAAFSSISVAFPTTAKGHTSATKTITLYNYLASSLNLTNVSFSGSEPNDFPIQGGTCPTTSGSVGGNSSCTYIIAFKPSTTTAESATLTITDGDGTQTVNLSGTGH